MIWNLSLAAVCMGGLAACSPAPEKQPSGNSEVDGGPPSAEAGVPTGDGGPATPVDGSASADDAPASPDDAPSIGLGDAASGSACATDPSAAPIEHSGAIMADETWAAGTHRIKYNVSVRMGATLTIAPCAVVLVPPNTGLSVWAGGTLVAEGTATQTIVFKPETTGLTWSPIELAGRARLAWLVVVGAGDISNDPSSAALWLRGSGAIQGAEPVARVAHVAILNAPKFGVRLDATATFTPDSTDLLVTGAGKSPILTTPGGMGSLPPGQYTGNAIDEVLTSGGTIAWDMTIKELGVPYHVGRPELGIASLRVSSAAVPLLTIEAGVVLRFERSADLEVEHFSGSFPATGALIVRGTAARPVVFTSAAAIPAAGDWMGISFGGVPDPRDQIDNARIEYAGGVSGTENASCFPNPGAPALLANQNRAALLIFGQPVMGFMTNTTIAFSAADGVERGWSGGEVDFLASNTFDQVAWCFESFPRPSMGACPVPIPCPR